MVMSFRAVEMPSSSHMTHLFSSSLCVVVCEAVVKRVRVKYLLLIRVRPQRVYVGPLATPGCQVNSASYLLARDQS